MRQLCIPAVVIALLAGAESAHAANLTALVHPGGFLNLLLLAGAVACLIFAFQLTSLVRGGSLMRSWQLFLVGFLLLSLAQLFALLTELEIAAFPSWLNPLLLTLMAAAFLYGLMQTKRVLG